MRSLAYLFPKNTMIHQLLLQKCPLSRSPNILVLGTPIHFATATPTTQSKHQHPTTPQHGTSNQEARPVHHGHDRPHSPRSHDCCPRSTLHLQESTARESLEQLFGLQRRGPRRPGTRHVVWLSAWRPSGADLGQRRGAGACRNAWAVRTVGPSALLSLVLLLFNE